MAWSRRNGEVPGAARRVVLKITAVTVPLGVWIVASHAVAAPVILPGPPAVLAALGEILVSGPAVPPVVGTVIRAMGALVISSLLGGTLGFLAGRFPSAATLLWPTITAIRSTPFISVILLALIWFPATVVPVFVAVLMTLPLVFEAARTGVRSCDPQLVEMAHLYRMPGLRMFSDIYLPAAAPSTVGGLRAANGIAWKVVVAAEVLAQPTAALGTRLNLARLYLLTEQVLAWTLILIVLSGLSDLGLSVLERRTWIGRAEAS